ncbi:MAG: magnesium transporter [Nitrospiraceae bacterium]
MPIETLLAASPDQRLDELRGAPPLEVGPETNAETVALLAVERHGADVTVVDAQRKLLGAIPIGRLLPRLHEEHVDDLLRTAGLGAEHPDPTEAHRTFQAFRARVPWLIIGLAGGWLAAGIASAFETALEREIALGFFLPLVVYMADAIGTQTETVLVRALAYGKVALLLLFIAGYLLREGALGLLTGLSIEGLAGVDFFLVGGKENLAVVVGLTLTVTSVAATLVATLLPWGLFRIGADPALASGPIATVLQDLLSLAVYLSIATALL